MLQHCVDPAASRTSSQGRSQLFNALFAAGGDDFNGALFGIAHPASQVEFAGFTMDEPPEPYPLHAPLYQEMKHHLSLTRLLL